MGFVCEGRESGLKYYLDDIIGSMTENAECAPVWCRSDGKTHFLDLTGEER
jgi:hypothetical protein